MVWKRMCKSSRRSFGKFLIHSAITASQHDLESTTMHITGHITGAIRAGASERELWETAAAIIPLSGMPSFGVFLDAWKTARQREAQPK
ncbi:MAG: hypothetical protein QHH21_01175 [Caldisericota bacterium]|nr:hypothetical protein [Caldisericota bacterium]